VDVLQNARNDAVDALEEHFLVLIAEDVLHRAASLIDLVVEIAVHLENAAAVVEDPVHLLRAGSVVILELWREVDQVDLVIVAWLLVVEDLLLGDDLRVLLEKVKLELVLLHVKVVPHVEKLQLSPVLEVRV